MSRNDKDARSEARREAAQLAQKQRAAAKRRRLLVQALIGVVAVALVVVVTVAVLSRGDDTPTVGAGGTPPQVTSDGGFVVGNPDAPVTITMVEDFQCPVCKNFETASGDALAQYAAGDDVKLEYRGIAFLDRMSSTDYSTRALNASACVMSQGEDVWQAFHTELYAQQPPEQGDGLPDSQLISIATDAGADAAAITPCIEDERYRDWTEATTQAAFDSGVTGTPTVTVNGTPVETPTPENLAAAVSAAQAA